MPKIAIIGGGCAGLGAATTLLGQNVSVSLFEATGQLGGRAMTSTAYAQLPVDLGPQFLQDPESNPWTAIMESQHLEKFQPDIGDAYRIKSDAGWADILAPVETMRITGLIDDGFEAAKEIANAPPIKPPAANLSDAWKLALGSNGYSAIAESVEPWQYIASDSGRQVSPPNGSPNIYVPGGLGTLVKNYGQTLIERYGRLLTVMFDAEVVRITSLEAQVVISFKDKDPQEFDYVIVTVPVSQLKKIAFDPAFTDARRTALNLVRLGSYKKVAFRPTAMPDDDDNAIKPNTEYYIYDPITDACWQYFRLPTNDAILICVTAGDAARRLDDRDQERLLPSILQNLLTAAYKPADRLQTNGNFTPVDNEVVMTNWTHQPFVEGAYSYTAYDDSRAEADLTAYNARSALSKPHGRVHFAGEALWEAAYGTIAGAYKSGEKAAGDVLALLANV